MPKVIILLTLLTATAAGGCVNLDTPKTLQGCAASKDCADAAIQSPGQDAREDANPQGPDVSSGDKPVATEDLGSDSPVPDAPADQVEQGTDAKDVAGTDGKETGTSSDADGGVPPADTGPDIGPDVIRQDVGPDLLPDLSPDLPPDLPPDLLPDLRPDLPPDVPPDANPLVTGLLAYYKCESASGTTLPDSSGNTPPNNGTLGGTGYTFAAGKVGNALTLAQASQAYVTLPPAMFANLTDITIATWVNVTTSQSWARVFDVGVDAKIANNTRTGTKYMNLVPKNGGTNLAFAISIDGFGSEQVLSAAALPTVTWKHVAVVLSAGQGSLYVDGALVAGPSAISLRPVDMGAIDYAYLGKSQFSNDPYFDGQIDEFRVYGRALSAAEIKALFQFAGP